MKRLLLLTLVAFLTTLAWVPVAQAVAYDVRLTTCASSLEQPLRTMVVQGRMRSLDGARKLQMRFELQILTAAKPRWTRVVAPGFGEWNTAEPAPKRYVFEKRIEALTAPARYRMVVRFRWLGAGDRQIAAGRRVSPTCRQGDLRPDLSPERVSVGPSAGQGLRRYVAVVRNQGGSPSGGFAVALAVNGASLAPTSVATGVGADGRLELVFSGPPCRPGSRLDLRVDVADAVDESDETDNRLVRVCPGSD